MEPNNSQASIAKKFWHMVRVAIFLLKKGISSKAKLLANLNLMTKGGKIAGKAIHNLMFHHNHHMTTPSEDLTTTIHHHLDEYEFSCSNTPKHYPFKLFKRKHHHTNYNQSSWLENIRTGPQSPIGGEELTTNAVMKALEMLQSETASPALPGFGRSPVVRQLKITDSPFPLNYGDEDNNQVDEAADEFIKKFYKNLRKQNLVATA